MSGYQFTNVASIEPVSAADGMLKGNTALYNVISGCAPTYSASNMTVDCASGSITHFGSVVSVTGGSAFWTLVADGSNPRWTWLAIDNTGAAVVVSGTAAATPSVPTLGDRTAIALVKVEAAQTVAANITTKIDKRIPAVASPFTYKYKSSSQTFTTSTTFADINASSGTFSFSAAASGVYVARYNLPITYGGTGGVKLQFTGPSSPTAVRISGIRPAYQNDNTGTPTTLPSGAPPEQTNSSSFSSSFLAYDSSKSGTINVAWLSDGLITVDLLVVNGSNAGTVTLQGAQNSSNSTTTFGTGCWMFAQRIA